MAKGLGAQVVIPIGMVLAQARHLVIPETIDAATAAAASGGPATSGRGALEPEQATLVSGASTFFVASYHEVLGFPF